MINLPTLRQLQYLLALSETRNFGKAAKACYVTQPTLSQAIVEMETILGAKVLDRSRKKVVTFTSFGEQALSTIKQIMPDLENLIDAARQVQKPLSGTIRLGIIPTIAPYLLPTILPHLQKKFDKIDFQITEDMSYILVERLEESKIDIALMALPFEIRNMRQIKLFEESFYCASPKGTFKKNQNLSTNDLDDHNLLLLQDGHCLRDHILSACKKTNLKNEQSLSTTSLHTLLQMIGHGYGITLLPEMVINNGIVPKNVELHSFKKPAPSRQIGLVWKDKTYKKSNISAIIDSLKAI